MSKLEKNKLRVLTAVFALFFVPVLINAQQDRFAEIGNKAAAVRTHLLVTPQPPVLPDIQLPLSTTYKKGFAPMNRMDTPEELEQRLQQARQQYQPFLKNVAPPVASTRDVLSLKQFGWRVETAADKKDFSAVLGGKGSWQPVSLPHYGPPLGKAVTYYQTEVDLPPSFFRKGSVFLCFKAVDYKAHVFVNGSYVGSHEGAFAAFEFDITEAAHEGKNKLLVKVENDYPMGGHVGDDGRKLDGDKIYAATGLGYDDPALGWHHNPPGMGIYQGIRVEARSSLHINDIFVRPIVDSDTAEVWLEVNNTEAAYKDLTVRYSLFGKNFSDTVFLNQLYEPTTVHIPGVGDLAKPTDWEKRALKMGKGVNFLRFRLLIPQAKRWSPEHPWLYQLQLELLDETGQRTDAAAQHFGMRSFRMDTVNTPKGAMYLNGRFIRLRGANTMGSFMRAVKEENWQQLADDILLAKIAGMNYIRMTQFPVQQEVYDYCDALGLLAQSDLPVFGVLRRNKWTEAVRQAEELERHVRKHPCNIMVSYINERFPNAEGSPQRHLDSYDDFEKFFAAADGAILLNNPDRVIKAGDGDYDPPSPGLPDNHVYNGWYNGHGLGLGEMYKGWWVPVKPGWYYACGEFGSEGLDFYNTMQRYYPKSWLPQNAAEEKEWTPNVIAQSQTFRFHYLWLNRQHTVQDWIKESQQHQAWVTRLTTESFRRNNSLVSFAIHLFIDAWPAGWMKTIMDVQRQPKPAFFEYAHGLAPMALSLRTDRTTYFSSERISVEAWLANDTHNAPAGHTLRYQWEQNGKAIAGGSTPAILVADSSRFQGFISLAAPSVNSRTVLTLRLQLVNERKEALHETDISITVFPKQKPVQATVFIAGDEGGLAGRLAREAGLPVVKSPADAGVLLVDDMQVYKQKQTEFDALAEGGKTIVFLQPPAGKWVIAGDTVTVSKTVMGQYYFASPERQQPLMKDFAPKDFFFWYNGDKALVRPLLGEMSEAKGWTPLLKTGQTGWVGKNEYAFAAAEKKKGNGVYRISHLLLNGALPYNPSALQFFHQLITPSNSSNEKSSK